MVRYGYPGIKVYDFARKEEQRAFARELGAVWAGDTTDTSPEKLDCIIDTTPVWKPVVEALFNLEKGGRLIINAIRKEDTDKSYLQNLSYPEHLWKEKEIKSVANVTGKDVSDFLKLAAKASIKPHTEVYQLEEANRALLELREPGNKGAKVLQIG
jgi:propanol-preferring alcohol dehydrogenase